MTKLPESLSDLNFSNVEVERAELRNGKIIIVIKPSLLSNQVFAVNPFYDGGDSKNQLKSASFHLQVEEKAGSVSVEANYSGYHFTTGHTQVHDLRSMFFTKIENAVYEILKSDRKYILDSDRMTKLVNNLETQEEKDHVRSLIDKRIEAARVNNMMSKKVSMLDAIKEYEAAVIGDMTVDDDGDFI